MELEALQNAASFGRRKRLVERRRRMCIQVILHQANVLGLRIDLIHQPAHDFRIVLHGALRSHLYVPPARTWLNHHKQVACPFPFVLVIHTLGLTRLHWNGRLYIGVEYHWLFIQADRRIVWVIMLFTKPNSTALP